MYYVSTWMTKSTQRKYQRFILIIIFTVIWIGCAWLVHVHKVISDHKRSLNLEMAWVLRRRSSKRANWARENRGALGFFYASQVKPKISLECTYPFLLLHIYNFISPLYYLTFMCIMIMAHGTLLRKKWTWVFQRAAALTLFTLTYLVFMTLEIV